jgi:hypothetical protein
MHLDFWNNPLIVSSLRVRYRRGSLMNLLTSYFLLLDAGGAVLFYYRARFPGPFPHNLLLGVLGAQFLISFIAASSTTSASVRNEVVNRTLDFQRIATLSPLQILLGKLLGEASFAFLSIIPTIPLSVYCCLILGVEGMNLSNLLLVYMTLLTTTILSGSLGLLQPLEADPSGKVNPANNLGAVMLGSFFCCVPALLTGGTSLLMRPWTAALLGVFTPIPTFVGIHQNDPWQYSLLFFGQHIPFILFTPISQLVLTSLILHAMVRRLVNPSRTIISRRVAFLLLFAFDLIVAGVFYTDLQPFSLLVRTAAFWVAHLCFGLFLVNLVTPNRNSLWSWLWRFRGHSSWLHDRALGDRSVNTLVLVIMAAIGLVDYFALVVGPSAFVFPPAAVTQFLPEAIQIGVACTVLFLAAGSLFQWMVVAFERSGRSLFFTLVLLLILPADLAGRYYRVDFLISLTPSGQFGHWFHDEPSQSLYAMVALYAAILLVTQLGTHRAIAAMSRIVAGKLELMQVAGQ